MENKIFQFGQTLSQQLTTLIKHRDRKSMFFIGRQTLNHKRIFSTSKEQSLLTDQISPLIPFVIISRYISDTASISPNRRAISARNSNCLLKGEYSKRSNVDCPPL